MFPSEPLIRNCGGTTRQPLDMIKIVENHNLSLCYNIILVYKITLHDDDIEKGSNDLAYLSIKTFKTLFPGCLLIRNCEGTTLKHFVI